MIKMTIFSLAFLFSIYTWFVYQLPVNEEVEPEALKGKMIWQEKNCTACHQLYGLGGFLGPDLTNVYSTMGPEYIKAFARNGTSIMPAFALSDEELSFLTAFLQHVDATGHSDPRQFKISLDGTIDTK